MGSGRGRKEGEEYNKEYGAINEAERYIAVARFVHPADRTGRGRTKSYSHFSAEKKSHAESES